MIIDQLFEDNNKKKLNETNARNYEQGMAEGGVEMPTGQATGIDSQTDAPPSRSFAVKIVHDIIKQGMASIIWTALEDILPRDYPRVPFQKQTRKEPQARVLFDLQDDGFSIVKQNISSQDIAETIASKFEGKGIAAEVIDGGIYEEQGQDPVATATQNTLNKLGSRVGAAAGSNIDQVTDAYEQKILDRMGKRFGLPPGSTAEQVQAAQQAYLDKNDPAAAAQYKQNMANIDAGGSHAANRPVQLAPVAEADLAEYTPKVGEEILWRPRFAKMVPVPVTVVAVAPGKLKIKLQSPRMIQNYGKDTIVVDLEKSDVMPKQGVTESRQRKLNEARLLEDPVYRNFKVIGRYIAERKLTEPEILKVFADAEAGMTDKATGANRTFLGRGKDTTMDFAGGVADALKGVWSGIQSSTPISLVDVAYDKATDALADLTGGQKGAVMQAINKYRMLAKEYPKTAGLAKGALVAITGLATGGAGLPAVAALVYGLDSAIKGEKFSDIALKAGGAAATAWAASKLASAFGSQPAPSDASAGSLDAADQVYQGAGGGTSGASVPVDGGTYTVMQGDQGGFIAQAQGVPFKDLEAMNPQITNWNKLPVGTELQLPPSGPNTGSVWQGYTGNNTAGPELLGGPSAGDVASPVADVAASAAVPAPSPLNLQPAATPGGPQFGTVTLPDGQTLKAAAFPEGGGITPRLPVGSTPVTINYNGQELTGRIVNDTVYFTKFPADAAAGTTASTAGTLSGVTGQQIMSSPVYQQVYAQEIAKWGAEPSARAIQSAQAIATAKAKAAMVGAVREATEFTRTVKMRQLPVDKLIDQKLTTMSWALNESVGKPQGRSMHLTPLGVYTVFENIRRVGEAAVEADAPWDLSTKPNDPRNLKPGDPGTITVPRRKPTAPAPAPTAPVNTTPTGPGREELPDLYRPDAPDAPYTPADPAKKSWFGKGLDYLDKGVKKVGGVIGNLGHQLTTGVTKEKLKMNWHVAGKPSDSDQLSAWLVKQGVPIGVVNGVYEKMGLPVSAEPTTPTDPAKAEPQARTGGAQKQMAFYGTNPATKKPWTYDELQAKARAGQATPASATADADATATQPTTTAGTFPGEDPTGPNYVGRREVARRQAARDAAAKTPAKPNFAQQGGGYKSVNYAPNIKTGVGLPKPAAAPAPAPTGTKVVSGGPTPDEQAKLAQRIAQAAKQPVAEMLSMVETKEDVAKIKQFIDQTFVKYGAVTESAFVVRNRLIEHVTQVGAQRRREHSRKAAH